MENTKKKTPRWVGGNKSNLVERPDSPESDFTLNGDETITRRYEGTYATCRAKRPRVGEAVKDLGSWCYVKSAGVTRLEGGKGLLTVVAVKRLGSDINDDGGENRRPDEGEYLNKEPIVEIEWLRIEKSLALHPRYKDITDEQWGQIKAWEAGLSDQPSRYATFKYQAPGVNWASLTDRALEYAKKIRDGTESYVIYTPIVRITNYYPSRPGTGGCGKKTGAPTAAPGGYQWLKTADRAIRQEGQWTRVQEWTGADTWDEELYGNPA